MKATVREIPTGSLTCMLCTREAAIVRVLADGTHARLNRPEDAQAVMRRRCPYCLGSLRVVDARIEIVRRVHLTPADLVPKKRGRPPKPPAVPTRRYHGPPCADCAQPVARYGSIRCQPCSIKQQRADAHHGQLVAALAHGEPVHRNELKQRLGISDNAFRALVKRMRRAGHRIPKPANGCYRLEAS